MGDNPVVVQATVVATFITICKAIIGVAKAFKLVELTSEQDVAVTYLVETLITGVAILVGAWWASKKVTSLTSAKDIDGTPLTRPDNSLPIPQQKAVEKAHESALKINEQINDREIQR
jgi:hypothetical protein